MNAPPGYRSAFMPLWLFCWLAAGAIAAPLAAAPAPARSPAPPTAPPRPPTDLTAKDTPNDGGESLDLAWHLSPDDTAGARDVARYVLLAAPAPGGPFTPRDTVPSGMSSASVEGLRDGRRWYVQVAAANAAGRALSNAASAVPEAQWWDRGRTNLFIGLVVFSAFFFLFRFLARRGRGTFVRPIPGLAALEEAVGRATEMGRPVLYIPGIQDLKDIQTICSMVILGDVAKLTARYDTPIIVPTADPVVLSAAEERVRGGYADAGRPEAYDPNNVRYLSNEQFAFVAGITGIIERQKPATIIYMGPFYAESLMLAETGFAAGAVQVAGTANVAQLPFFVVACDYTLIGEELYAASAYLSRDPELMGSLKASDLTKVVLIFLIVLGAVLLLASHNTNTAIADWFRAQ